MRSSKYKYATVALMLATSVLSGCAGLNTTTPALAQQRPLLVKFADANLSAWTDLPLGYYQVPNSQLIVSGYGGSGIGPIIAAAALGGVVGVVLTAGVESAVKTSATKNAVSGEESALRVTLTDEGQETTRSLVAAPDQFSGRFRQSYDPTAPVLTISGIVVLWYATETDLRPYLILKATIHDPTNIIKNNTKGGSTRPGQDWERRYIVSSGPARPLSGDSGWASDSGAALRSVVSDDLKRGIGILLKDVSSPYAKDDAHLTLVHSSFPYMKARLQTVGYLVDEDEHSIVYIPKVDHRLLFSGVNVMDKEVTTYRAVTDGDDRHVKLLDDHDNVVDNRKGADDNNE